MLEQILALIQLLFCHDPQTLQFLLFVLGILL
jgi:hypothetical protein